MSRDRADRVRQILRNIQADFAVLSSPDSVCYVTGHSVPIEIGPTPFAGGPTLAVVTRDGVVGLLRPSHEVSSNIDVDFEILFDGFTGLDLVDYAAAYLIAAGKFSKALGLSGRAAVEPSTYPAILTDVLGTPGNSIAEKLIMARATKTKEEHILLEEAARIAAVGQNTARNIAASNLAEIELFGRIRQAMEVQAGHRLPVTADILTGVERTAAHGGWPTARKINRGDPVLCDLGPRVSGYWADSCGSFTVGEPSAAYERMFAAVKDALALAQSIIMPGLRACDLDAQMRGFLNGKGYSYPHHSGHGIGASVHEYPRIVPNQQALIQEDMVLMIEPAAYLPDVGGIRLEHMFRVTSNGVTPIAPFELSLGV